MTEIDVLDWVVEAALLATSDPSETSLTHAEYARAIIIAALGAWVVPQHQCMCTDEDELPNGPRDIWMDVSADDFEKFTERNDVRGRILYTLRQEKPDVLP